MKSLPIVWWALDSKKKIPAIFYHSTGDVEPGFGVYDANENCIYMRDDLDIILRYLTLLHEYGHWLLPNKSRILHQLWEAIWSPLRYITLYWVKLTNLNVKKEFFINFDLLMKFAKEK